MALHRPLESLSDDDLLARLAAVVHDSRRGESTLLNHIAEVDLRRLYAREACPSMFVYCTRRLHLAEGAAFRRIRVARASRKHPVVIEMVADGRLHVSGIAVLVPFLTRENRDRLLSLAVHKTKRQIQKLVAELHPRPDVPSVMRKLPDKTASVGAPRSVGLVPGTALDSPPAVVSHAAPPALASDRAPGPIRVPFPVIEPLSPARYRIQFTAGEGLHEDLERLRGLLRAEIPDGDLAAIVGKAVRELRQRLEARRYGKTSGPRKTLARTSPAPSSRNPPAAVRRLVYSRDESQCRFRDAEGRRCPERHNLQYHHMYPFALGGGHGPENICLMCPAHNLYLAEHVYGKEAMSRHTQTRTDVEPDDSSWSVDDTREVLLE